MFESLKSLLFRSESLMREKALRSFFESTPMMMGVVEVEGNDIRHVSDNKAAGRFFNAAPKRMQGRLESELGIPREEINLWLEKYRQAESRCEPVTFAYRSRSSFEKSEFSATVSFIERADSGNPRFSYIVQDVSHSTAELQMKSDALENSLNGFDIVNAEGKLVYANRAYLKMWGYESLEEVIGTSPADHCADPAVPMKIIQTLKQTGECNIEFLAKRKDGSTFEVNMWARLAHDANGNEIYPTTSIDISESKKSEEQLRASHHKFETIFKVAPFATALVRMPGGEIVDVNAEWTRLTGFSREEAIGKNSTDLRMYRNSEDGRKLFEEFQRKSRIRGVETGIRNKSGEDRVVLNFMDTIEIEGKKHLLGTIADITDLKRAHEDLQQSERILDQVFSGSPAFMTVIELPDFRYIRSNEEHYKLIGRRDILGKTVSEVLPELEAQGIIALLKQVVETGRPYVGTELPVTFRGVDCANSRSVYLDFIYQPLRRSDGEIYAIAAQGYVVTEKVLSRKAVENERENFRNLFMQTPEMVCILEGPDHVFEFVNEAHVKTLGFDATGLAVRKAQPESVEVHGILDEVYRTGKTAQHHEIPVTVGDRLRYFNLTYSAKRDAIGKINGIMILGVEVTDQVVSRKELEETKAQFESLSNSIPQLAWMADSQGWIYWYNQRWYDYTGTTLDEMQGWGWEKVHHPDHRDRIVNFVKDAWQRPEPFELTFPLKSKTGEWRWFLTRAVPIRDRNGSIIRWFGTNTDVTDQKEAEEKIRALHIQTEAARKELYDFFMQAPAALVVLMGPDHRFLLANPPYERMVNRKVIGKTVLEAFKREEVGTFIPLLDRVYQTGEPFIGSEMPLQLPNESGELQSIFINVGYHPFRDPDGTIKGVLAVHQDVTDQVLARQKVEKLAADLKEAVHARDEFLSIASHELRTPLTSLKLQTQGTKRNASRNDPEAYSKVRMTAFVEQADRQVDRLAHLVDDMLDISRITSGKLTVNFEDVDLKMLINEVAERMQPQVSQSGCELKLDLQDHVVGQWDRHRVEQVITNLLTNAAKYGAGKPIEVSLRSVGNGAEFRVRDYGRGIDPKDHERVFHRFERAVSASEISGLGLGLFISKQIVELLGGKIRVESELSKGATFIVALPQRQAKQSPGLTSESQQLSKLSEADL